MIACPNCRQEAISKTATYWALLGIRTRCPSCSFATLIPARVAGGLWGERAFYAGLAVALFGLLWLVHPIAALLYVMLALLALLVWGDLRTYQGLRKREQTKQPWPLRKASAWFAIGVVVLGAYHVVRAVYQYYAG